MRIIVIKCHLRKCRQCTYWDLESIDKSKDKRQNNNTRIL